MNHRWLQILLLGVYLLVGSRAAVAQEQPPDDADPANGVRLYQQRCANCHGPQGMGDGELAENLPNAPAAIGSEAYLATADPQQMFQVIQNGNIAAGMPGFGVGNNSDPLSNRDIWDIIAGLGQLQILNQPISEAVIIGRIDHAEARELPPDLTVSLQAFDESAGEALTLETTIDPDGSYRFDLQQIPPTWFYRTSVNYQQVDFTSPVVTFDPLAPTADLPITLFETTTSDDNIRLSRLAFLVEFINDQVQIAEFYTFDNQDLTVYTGRSGDPSAGTVYVTLPPESTNPVLLRAINGGTNLIPLEGIVADNGDLGAPVPIGPGPGTLELVLRYEVPFSSVVESDFARDLRYDAAQIEMILPETGVTVRPESGWSAPQSFGDGIIGDGLARSRFTYSAPEAAAAVNFPLTGWPTRVVDSNGNLIVNRQETQELFVGGLALLIVAAVCGYVSYRWTQATPMVNDKEELLMRVAALDEAYARENLPRGAYRQRRAQLLRELRELFDQREKTRDERQETRDRKPETGD
ncbi:MAG: cytochrome c [Ardenticatenaceae bacterium]|nr:cytochrome c [Ardenticatenaceae bacterium]